MIGATIVEITGAIVFCLMVIFIIKNYIKKFIQSNEPYKNVLLLIFCITLTLGSIYFSTLGYDLKNIILTLIRERDSLGPESIAKLEHQKLTFERATFIVGTLLTIILTWFCILYVSIKKDVKEFMNSPRRRWDWKRVE